jgi:enolase
MRVKNVICTKIFDSRGEPTLEIALVTNSGIAGTAQVPSGKSRGTGEASVVSFDRAVRSAKGILPAMRRRNFLSPNAFDRFLLARDGTPDKRRLGGNFMLGLSLAFARAMATLKKQELWELIEECYFSEKSIALRKTYPMIFSNLINGGAHALPSFASKNLGGHAATNLAIQEYIAVARPAGTPAETVARIIALYREVGRAIERRTGLKRLPLGDEGGYAVDFPDNGAPLELLARSIKKLRFDKIFSLAIDAASSEFFKNGRYYFEGKKLRAPEMAEVYASYLRRVPSLMSVEDPCAENDPKGFGVVHARLPGVWIIGDDLTVTSAARVARYIEDGCITGAIIKPNQIGTLSETCDAITAAQKRGARIIVSHRSGETGDAAIIHIAKACSADAVKIGAPARERLLKFNEYIRIFS